MNIYIPIELMLFLTLVLLTISTAGVAVFTMKSKTGGLSVAEERLLGHLVMKTRQPWSTWLFNILIKLLPVPAVYGAIFRMGKSDVPEIFLVPRFGDQTFPDGILHIVGKVPTNRDVPGPLEANVLERLRQSELSGVGFAHCQLAGINLTTAPRGEGNCLEFSVVNTCELEPGVTPTGRDNEPLGTWFPVNQLHPNVIPHEFEYILPLALKSYCQMKNIPYIEPQIKGG